MPGARPAENYRPPTMVKRTGACALCHSPDAELQCSRCKLTFYCNAACQRGDWTAHKRACMQSASRGRVQSPRSPGAREGEAASSGLRPARRGLGWGCVPRGMPCACGRAVEPRERQRRRSRSAQRAASSAGGGSPARTGGARVTRRDAGGASRRGAVECVGHSLWPAGIGVARGSVSPQVRGSVARNLRVDASSSDEELLSFMAPKLQDKL